MLEIWLIRHGETAWNAEDRILALRDMPLNDRGRTQAERLRQRFERDRTSFDAVYASDLSRARTTAEQARRWRAEPYARRAPEGESYADVIARFAAFATSLPRSGRFAAFSHGGTIRCVLYGLMGRPPPAYEGSTSPTPASRTCAMANAASRSWRSTTTRTCAIPEPLDG